MGMNMLVPFTSLTSHKYGLMIGILQGQLYSDVLPQMEDWCVESFTRCNYLITGNYFYFAKEDDRDWFMLRWT